MNENDLRLLRHAIEVSRRSREHGNHPFGAILVDRDGNVVMEGENIVVTERDCTGHAETNLMRMASKKFDADYLAGCTLYSSAEPCPMCSGAIYWGNVRRVVYALAIEGLFDEYGDNPENFRMHMHCRDVLERVGGNIEVLGPALQEEAKAAHAGFWK
jgi:tRNA(Arg) A34 adenosine deaminase TadA